MPGRVTLQDIADALGLSRNTVSKAINNTGTIADATREKILQKAVEMGYKQFSYVSVSNGTNITASVTTPGTTQIETSPYAAYMPDPDKKIISLFTTMYLGNSHFSSTMLDKFQREISALGYSLVMNHVSREDLNRLTLPLSFNRELTAGIICFEMFHQEYSEMLCSMDLPVLFVDAPANAKGNRLRADKLLMDNRTNLYALMNELADRGLTKFGFIGKPTHCMSFFERYMAFREALALLGLEFHEEYCFTQYDGSELTPEYNYKAYLYDCIRDRKDLPEVFICANDFVAIDALQVLRKMNLRVPEDIKLVGFDDSSESRIVTPPLTTIHIHTQIMGFSAVHLLMSRIRQPSLNYRTIYTETSLIYRESTGDK